VFSGVGLRATLERKFDEAGVAISDRDNFIERMSDHLLASRSDNTVAKYSHQVKLFKDFCAERHFPCKPAYPMHVAMYLSSLIDSGKSDSVVMSAYYGIKWYHNISDSKDPTDSQLVQSMLECAKRLNSKPIVNKDVVISEQLVTLCNMFVGSTDVVTLSNLSIILLSYAVFCVSMNSAV